MLRLCGRVTSQWEVRPCTIVDSTVCVAKSEPGGKYWLNSNEHEVRRAKRRWYYMGDRGIAHLPGPRTALTVDTKSSKLALT